ncbi:SOS response-associated peptidase family protein [Hydrogenophaga defluvii]|uniref:SOS response-associated peptidase family protein n=1 Tax=Hydrogenophaga defluvii TaxID=249410 RepID=A0ABW2SFJ3_9BURK
MCYSASVVADHRTFQRMFPTSRLSLQDFHELYGKRKERTKPLLRTPRVMDALFSNPQSDKEREIQELIKAFSEDETAATQKLVFEQRVRLAAAQRKLAEKQTKGALEDERIATDKIADGLAKLKALQRTDLSEGDGRIFPQWFAPILMFEDGQPVIRPMRYQCRPAGMPAKIDRELPGVYNARFDSLRKFWRGLYGRTHGVMLATTFFENVKRHDMEHRELLPGEKPENVVLRFEPRQPHPMWVACLVSHWTPLPGSSEAPLWSFSAITNEPPPEVASAGHDRCIVELRPQNVQAWLTPAGRSLDELDQLLLDKEPAYYEHRLAA